MTECVGGGLKVFDNHIMEEIELSIKLPWSQYHANSGNAPTTGAMQSIARDHKTRKRWGDISSSMQRTTPDVSAQKLVHTKGLGNVMLESHRRQQAANRTCFFVPHGSFRVFWDVTQVVILLCLLRSIFVVRNGFDTRIQSNLRPFLGLKCVSIRIPQIRYVALVYPVREAMECEILLLMIFVVH